MGNWPGACRHRCNLRPAEHVALEDNSTSHRTMEVQFNKAGRARGHPKSFAVSCIRPNADPKAPNSTLSDLMLTSYVQSAVTSLPVEMLRQY